MFHKNVKKPWSSVQCQDQLSPNYYNIWLWQQPASNTNTLMDRNFVLSLRDNQWLRWLSAKNIRRKINIFSHFSAAGISIVSGQSSNNSGRVEIILTLLFILILAIKILYIWPLTLYLISLGSIRILTLTLILIFTFNLTLNLTGLL